MDCPSCRAPAPDGAADCPACGVIFAKWAEKAARAKARKLAAAQADLDAEFSGDAPVPSPRDVVLVPAAVFAAAGVLTHVEFARFLIQSGLSMQIHEFGHALVNWLGGRLALPLPMITFAFSRDRSYVLALAVAASLVWLLKTAWDEGCAALAGLCGLLLLAQFWLTLVARPDTLDFLVAFGGLGGECYVAAALVILYFHPLPRAARWPRYRVVFLFVGACVLAASLRRWRDADADFMNVPWGSFWGGDGDVEAMLAAGWTVNVLVKVYLRLVWSCVGAAALAWGLAAWSARERRASAAKLVK